MLKERHHPTPPPLKGKMIAAEVPLFAKLNYSNS
jgi:hypothetical protein